MQTVEIIYRENIAPLRDAEKLQIAAKILNDLSQSRKTVQHSAVKLLETMPSGRLFKTAAEADEYLRLERESWDK